MNEVVSNNTIRASSCATRLGRLRRGLGLGFVLLLLASCAANNTDDMLAQAEREIAAAQASAERRVADAERQVADARSQVEAITRENTTLRDGQKELQGALRDAESRAAAIEATLQRTQRAADESQRALTAAQQTIDELSQRPTVDAVVPLDQYEQTVVRLEEVEAALELASVSETPAYDVQFRGPSTMAVDEQAAISIEVSVPEGGLGRDEDGFLGQIPAVSQTLRATLHGSNFEIIQESDIRQSMIAGKAVWDFRVRPVLVGEQQLHASIVQYAPEDTDTSPVRLRTDSWTVSVTVGADSKIRTDIARNLGSFAIAIITFFGGMIAEYLRRRFLRGRAATS
ncbi:MAG: hypothetical protein AAFY29_18510 [Pseudomonadota bacterium]